MSKYSGNSSKFQHDLQLAEVAQVDIFNKVCDDYPTVFGCYSDCRPSNADDVVERKQFDVITYRPSISCMVERKYEIKDDQRSRETGNIFIATECSGNPAGINATTADYWLHRFWHKDSELILIAFVDHLRAYINRHKLSLRTIRQSGSSESGLLISTQEAACHFMLSGLTTYNEYRLKHFRD